MEVSASIRISRCTDIHEGFMTQRGQAQDRENAQVLSARMALVIQDEEFPGLVLRRLRSGTLSTKRGSTSTWGSLRTEPIGSRVTGG